MRVLILGGDGYLGWPTAMALNKRGHDVGLVDNFAKRSWERELGIRPLFPLPTLQERIEVWQEKTGNRLTLMVGDLTDYPFVAGVLQSYRPDAIVHYGEQPSAPFSMIDAAHAVFTQRNNIVGTLNILFAMRDFAADAHMIKLGTMGEYGTPNIDIEEGYLTVSHNGRSHTFLYPKAPGSFYHLSKVHDSHNIDFAVRTWGLRATELNQGVVYGVETQESASDPRLATSFHYDEVFGTALNRFCAQAAVGHPLTVYGAGGQTRGFLNIRDTLACVTLALENPARASEMRVFNQFTEQFSVTELAERVRVAGERLGWTVRIESVHNPRLEAERHYYNARHSKLIDLGLVPTLLTDELVEGMLVKIAGARDRIERASFVQNIAWVPRSASQGNAAAAT
jgi:UDP-sulfoquinovose synthase